MRKRNYILLALTFFLYSCFHVETEQKSVKIAIASDMHLYNDDTHMFFDRVISDMSSNASIDYLFILGDWATYRFNNHDFAWSKIQDVIDKNMFHINIIDGNHEWDEYASSNRMNTIDTSSSNRFLWITHFPYRSSELVTNVRKGELFIKVEDASLFSLQEAESNKKIGGLQTENMIVLVSQEKSYASLSFIESIDLHNNIIHLKQPFAYDFKTNDKVVQGRDSEKISNYLKETQRQDRDAKTLSHTVIIGNNAFIMLSVEDYFKSVRILPNNSGLAVHINEHVMSWLENELSTHQDKNVFVMSHWSVSKTGLFQSPVGDNRSFDIQSSEKIRELLVKYDVVAWFSGHSHIPPEASMVQYNLSEDFGGTTFIHVPSSGMQPSSISNNNIDHDLYGLHWRYIELKQRSNEVIVRTRESENLEWLSEETEIVLKMKYRINLNE